MGSRCSAILARRAHVRHVRRSRGRAAELTLALVVIATALVGFLVAPECVLARGAVVVPERIGSFARASGERWGYLYSNAAGVGATISKGARSDTRKVTRTLEYGVSARERGLTMDAVAEHTVRYEVYVGGSNRGKIYRVYQPKVTFRRASGRLLYLWKLSVKLKSTVMSVSSAKGGGHSYRVKHELHLALPRQPLLPRSRWVELARQLAEAKTGSYVREVTIVPDGRWGRLVVGFE